MRLNYMSVRPIASYEPGYVEGQNLFVAAITYAGANGEVKLNLGADFCTRILALVADEMVKGSQEIATKLTAEIITQAALAPNGQTLLPASDL